MAEQTSALYTEILRRLNAVLKKENRLSLLYGALAWAMSAIALAFFSILLERVVHFGPLGRTIVFLLSAIGIAASFGWFVARPLLRLTGVLRSRDRFAVAGDVGKHFPSIRDRLLDAIQLYESRDRLGSYYSLDLVDASFSDLFEQMRPLEFTEVVDGSRVRSVGKRLSVVFAICALVLVTSPSGFLGSLYRIVHFNQSFAAMPELELFVTPGNVEVLRGDSVEVIARTRGLTPDEITLHTKREGELEFDHVNVRTDSSDTFSSLISDIKSSTEYYISAGEIVSTTYKINVVDRPLIRSFQLTVTPPRYTGIPSRALEENVGDLSAYPGSVIDLRLTSSKELSGASVRATPGPSVTLNVSGTDISGRMRVTSEQSYQFELLDRNGLANLNPVEYSIKVIPDEYPTVEILAPARDLDLTEHMTIDLLIRAADDFGFSKLRLAYRLTQSKYEQPAEEFSFIEIPLATGNTSPFDVRYLWNLSPLNLVPEDAVAYYVELFDNDAVSGPKSAVSETYQVRLPSLEEVFSDVTETHQQSIESMENVARETEQLKKDIEEMQREVKKSRERMDWQQQKKMEDMTQRYESMKKKLEETSRAMDEMMKQMDDNKLLSNETMDKYLELQKLMEELQSPELQEALKKMQESMKNLSPEQMRQAMEQMKFSEEQFRKSLERTIELLKRIHIEQKIDELIKRAEELQRQQEQIRQQSEQTNPADQQKREELAKKQEGLKEEMDALEREASDLKKKMEEFAKEMPAQEMSQAESELKEQQLQSKMEESARQMQSGNMKGAQKEQKETGEALEQFKDQMMSIQKALQDQQQKEVVNQMRKQIQNLIELSQREEGLKSETQSLDPNSQRFREGAQRQMEMIEDVGKLANEMNELAKKTFAIGPEMGKEIGNALRQMGEAMQRMEGRNPAGTTQKQGEAMESLNRAAMMMQNSLGQMMQGGQGGMGMAGLMGRLGQMAGSQGGINSGTQQAMGGGQGQGQLTPQQQAEYGRLAAQQGAVQKSLEQIAAEAKNAGDFSKLLGDLDRIAEEMAEVQSDLSQGNVNPETVKKQERILSRLLDSQRSMRERDYEKRRKAEAGKEYRHASPSEIDFSTQEGRNRLREELLKVREGKYSRDYEELIRKYFELLEKTQSQVR